MYDFYGYSDFTVLKKRWLYGEADCAKGFWAGDNLKEKVRREE